MRKLSVYLSTAIFVGVIVLSTPTISFAAGNPTSTPGSSVHCNVSSANQVCGKYTYSSSYTHYHGFTKCRYSYKQNVCYRKCVICGTKTTCYGEKYDEVHKK